MLNVPALVCGDCNGSYRDLDDGGPCLCILLDPEWEQAFLDAHPNWQAPRVPSWLRELTSAEVLAGPVSVSGSVGARR